jgi:hypothetical protein
MSGEYRWGRAVFFGPWTEMEASEFIDRVRAIMAAEDERKAVEVAVDE